MESYLKIVGQKKLSGEISISGSKNLCVALIPSALICKDIVILKDIPPISDVKRLIVILNKLNVKTEYVGSTLKIDSRALRYADLDIEDMSDLRASYYFYSVMIGMFHKLKAGKAGGCKFGERPINLHLEAFEKFGVNYIRNEDHYIFDVDELIPNTINFSKVSVGASINAAILAVLIKGRSIIRNVALEPEVKGLISFLVKMGADISWSKKNELVVEGGKPLKGCTFKNIKDRIESGTYALIGASSGDNIIIKDFPFKHNLALLKVFDKLNVKYSKNKRDLVISSSIPKGSINIKTLPYPGFPTDLQQPLSAFLSVGGAHAVIEETIYHNRFAHVQELISMGADIKINGNKIEIKGVSYLLGKEVNGKDLRGGASLVIASLTAKGVTTLKGLKYINRGYDSMVHKLKLLGAVIETIDSGEEI